MHTQRIVKSPISP